MSKIIIVDDQPTNRAVYTKMAASVGSNVRVGAFANPYDAFQSMLDDIPDLVITDYLMPGMNGAQLIRRIRSEPALADIPIIAITVHEETSYRFRALDAGATDFLLSPVNHREFVTRARNLLKMREQQLLLAGRAEQLERQLESKEQSLEQIVRDSGERLAQVIDSVPALISATDQDGRLLFVNDYHTKLFGVDPAAMGNQNLEDFFGHGNLERRKVLDQLVLRSGRSVPSFEEEIVDQSGDHRVFLTTKSPLNDTSNQTYGVVTSAIDITEQKAAQHHLHFLAHHDSLTGLPNRVWLLDQARREIARSRRGDRRFALHIIDLDGFKQVNDAEGHSIGDHFLRGVAQRLQSVEREGCIIGRMGGDEFVALQTDLPNTEAAITLAEEIRCAVREPFVIGGKQAIVTASVGIAQYPVDGQEFEELLRYADIAMYRAKAGGGDQYALYSSDRGALTSKIVSFETQLRTATERGEFALHYQPQVRLDTGEVTGAEALIRWETREGTLIYPGEFLPQAEENGLILPISEWVLREACRQSVAWRRMGLPRNRVSINVSPVQFRRQGFPLLVTRVLSESGLDPSAIELELTENFLVQDVDLVATQLHQLRALGVSISIDDFGTGFSSLCHLKQLPIDRLKIDQSFVRDIASDPSDRAIVASIINLAHSLKMEVIAEGVENKDQLECLRAGGCNQAQGFYFGRPMPADEFAAFIAPSAKIGQAG